MLSVKTRGEKATSRERKANDYRYVKFTKKNCKVSKTDNVQGTNTIEDQVCETNDETFDKARDTKPNSVAENNDANDDCGLFMKYNLKNKSSSIPEKMSLEEATSRKSIKTNVKKIKLAEEFETIKLQR